MAILIIPTGLPGSGKTTFFRAIGIPKNRIISPDEELTTNGVYEWTEARNARAWRRINKQFAKFMARYARTGDEYVLAFDATFTTTISRCTYINIANSEPFQFNVHGLYFNTPVEVCVQRNNARPANRRVPDERMRSFISQLKEPRLEEEYNTLEHITPETFDEKVAKYRRLMKSAA